MNINGIITDFFIRDYPEVGTPWLIMFLVTFVFWLYCDGLRMFRKLKNFVLHPAHSWLMIKDKFQNFVVRVDLGSRNLADKLSEISEIKKVGIFLAVVGTIATIWMLSLPNDLMAITYREIQYIKQAEFFMLIVSAGFLMMSGLAEEGIKFCQYMRERL